MLQRSSSTIRPYIKPWSPKSWRDFPARMQPIYENGEAFARTLDVLRSAKSLTNLQEISRLKEALAEVSCGQRSVLHAGDCAERFVDGHREAIAGRARLLREGAAYLGEKTLVIARMGGQYFKPRSYEFELNDPTLQVYRGDGINGFEKIARKPDPLRLIEAYRLAATTRQELSGEHDFFLSHEGMHLSYEEALVQQERGVWYCGSAPLLWIGERTRALNEAHVEFFRGVANPLAVKLGATATPEDVENLCAVLNPHDEPGKLIFIPRLGVKTTEELLPQLLSAAQNRSVVWIIDPMHGNTVRKNGKKRRFLSDIEKELQLSKKIFERAGVNFGIHLEVTPDDVMECTEVELDETYSTTYCDPRLNAQQFFKFAASARPEKAF